MLAYHVYAGRLAVVAAYSAKLSKPPRGSKGRRSLRDAGVSDRPSGSGAYGVGRYYDPTTGQFLTVDPLVDQTESPYGYAGQDPINGSDPSGALTITLGGGSWTSSNPVTFGGGPQITSNPASTGGSRITLHPASTGGSRITSYPVTLGGGSWIAPFPVTNGGMVTTSQRNNPEQETLIELAKAKKRGVTPDEADTLLDWAAEYGVPHHGQEQHTHGSPISRAPHIHIGPVGHIPVKP